MNNAERTRAWQKLCQANGVCIICRKRPLSTRSVSRCDYCLDRFFELRELNRPRYLAQHRDQGRRWRQRHKHEHIERVRRLRQHYLEQGRCLSCSRPLHNEDDIESAYCDSCSSRWSRQQLRRNPKV